jgi:hypothetical protein
MPFCASRPRRWPIIGLAAAVLLAPARAGAQYLGHDIRGDNGPSAGSQPFPGVDVAVPCYVYDVKSLHNNGGRATAQLLTTIRLATLRYFWEAGARSSFQGQALFLAFTIGRLWPAQGP